MPIYEYQCQSCEHYFDVLQKMSDDPLTYCPECGEQQLKKLLSAPNFGLKGSGWYETDFKRDKQRNLHQGDSKKRRQQDRQERRQEGGPEAGRRKKAGKSADST